MSDVAIRITDLGKRFRLRHERAGGYRTLREDLLHWPARLLRRMQPSPRENFWALRDVSFDVLPGEIVGLIGRNGAGKSTLLKIVARILAPTTGAIDLHGRVGSLLEVGTGFHAELSGRENIFLGGALLGMRRAEIRQRFDEIVAFAEVEKFLDTPCKHYSSGMYMRLAFAVAAHLDAEILLVDEVLAVGDLAFQQKSLGKMNEIARSGRTVLFVSHNLSAVRQMCTTCLWLEGGRVHQAGASDAVIGAYLRDSGSRAQSDAPEADGSRTRIATVRLLDRDGAAAASFCIGDQLALEFLLVVPPSTKISRIKLGVAIRTADGIPIANMVDVDSAFELHPVRPAQWVRVMLDDLRFYPGVYYVSIWAGGIESIDEYASWPDAITFTIVEGGGRTARRLPRSAGLVFLTPSWRAEASTPP